MKFLRGTGLSPEEYSRASSGSSRHTFPSKEAPAFRSALPMHRKYVPALTIFRGLMTPSRVTVRACDSPELPQIADQGYDSECTMTKTRRPVLVRTLESWA